MNEYVITIEEYFGNPVYSKETKVVIVDARTGKEAVKKIKEENKWDFNVVDIKKL